MNVKIMKTQISHKMRYDHIRSFKATFMLKLLRGKFYIKCSMTSELNEAYIDFHQMKSDLKGHFQVKFCHLFLFRRSDLIITFV